MSAVPLSGIETSVMVKVSPSGSVSFSRTSSRFSNVSAGVVASSSPATGDELGESTVTVTVAVSVPPLPSSMV